MHIKNHFITGLITLLPLAITIAIVAFIFNLLTGPFLGIVQSIFTYYHVLDHGFLFLDAQDVQNLVAKICILITLFFLVVGLGMLARWFFFNTLIDVTEQFLKKIPLVRSIYKICRDMIHTLFTSKANSFKQVVLVKFPHNEAFSLGFITRDDLTEFDSLTQVKTVAVFIPTTPNPTSGFLIMFEPKDLIYLHMKVEDAFKYIISCGMIAPEFQCENP